jgi:hypothetical protein
MAGQHGIRQPFSVATITDAPAADYADGQICFAVDTGFFHGLTAGAWVAFTVS